MISILAYIGAAVAEIAGCFAFWAWLRLDHSAAWLIPGMAALALFAYLLTLVDSAFAGRAYAAYGGVYIAASLAWLWLVEGSRRFGLAEHYPSSVRTEWLLGDLMALGCDCVERFPRSEKTVLPELADVGTLAGCL